MALAIMLACVPSVAQARTVQTVVQDDALLLHGTDEQIRTGVQRAHDLGFTHVRLTAGWSVIAPQPDGPEVPDFDATDPAAYPAGNWANLDRAVRLAHEAGLESMIDIAFWAPRWATKDPAETADRLATEIDPAAYAKFAQAVATRYGGTWTPPVGGPAPQPDPSPDRTVLDELFGDGSEPGPATGTSGEPAAPLPAADTFTIWNEPNHPGFLRPQWRQVDGVWVPRSAEIYREMVHAAYPVIKAAAPGARVLVGGTASMGSSTPNVAGVPPLRFLRALACVDERLRRVTSGSCAGYRPIEGDGWAHHPYSLRTTPDVDTRDPDKLPVAATRRLTSTLRALVASGRVAPGLADVYMTEYGYETNRPDPSAPFSLQEQAGLLAWAEFIATSDPAVRMWPQFQLYDRPSTPPRPGMREFGDWQSGLFFDDGTPKPAAATYATPAFASCTTRGRRQWTLVWGRMRRAAGESFASVESRDAAGRWRVVDSFDRPGSASIARASVTPDPGDSVVRYLPHRRGAVYRLRWIVPGGERLSDSLTVAPARCGRPASTGRGGRKMTRRKATRRVSPSRQSRRPSRRA
jgi:hypothetical protein